MKKEIWIDDLRAGKFNAGEFCDVEQVSIKSKIPELIVADGSRKFELIGRITAIYQSLNKNVEVTYSNYDHLGRGYVFNICNACNPSDKGGKPISPSPTKIDNFGCSCGMVDIQLKNVDPASLSQIGADRSKLIQTYLTPLSGISQQTAKGKVGTSNQSIASIGCVLAATTAAILFPILACEPDLNKGKLLDNAVDQLNAALLEHDKSSTVDILSGALMNTTNMHDFNLDPKVFGLDSNKVYDIVSSANTTFNADPTIRTNEIANLMGEYKNYKLALDIISGLSSETHIPAGMIMAVISQECGWKINQKQISSAGARGPMQVMDAMLQDINAKHSLTWTMADLDDIEKGIVAGVAALVIWTERTKVDFSKVTTYKQFKEAWTKVLDKYSGGHATYSKSVLSKYEKFFASFDWNGSCKNLVRYWTCDIQVQRMIKGKASDHTVLLLPGRLDSQVAILQVGKKDPLPLDSSGKIIPEYTLEEYISSPHVPTKVRMLGFEIK